MKFKKIKKGAYAIEGLGCEAKVVNTTRDYQTYGEWTATATLADGTRLLFCHNTRWMAAQILELEIYKH
jgi:hypothetical protein